jgi:epoxyqueuosine reductase
MDATRCISYLTIEHRGPIPVELRPLMGNRVYGCDICQEVCPWNERFAEPSDDPAYGAREGLDGPSLLNLTDELLSLSSEEFSARFRKSPIKRAKRAGLLRNLCIALGNWGMEDAESILARALGDDEPMVRGHAAWALGRIDTVGANTSLQRRLKVEMDAWVREEIVDAAR